MPLRTRRRRAAEPQVPRCGQCGAPVPQAPPEAPAEAPVQLPAPQAPPEPEPGGRPPCSQCTGAPPAPPSVPAPPVLRPARCCQCGGPALPGCRVVVVEDRYGREIGWGLCSRCEAIMQGGAPHTEIIADVISARCGFNAERALAQLDQLTTQPAPHPCAAVEVTWPALAQRMVGFGPYYRVDPLADPRNPYGARWSHLAPELVGQLLRMLDEAVRLRTPAPPTCGGVCSQCSATHELPGRWGYRAGAPVCGACQDGTPAALAPAYPGAGRGGLL